MPTWKAKKKLYLDFNVQKLLLVCFHKSFRINKGNNTNLSIRTVIMLDPCTAGMDNEWVSGYFQFKNPF